MSPFEPLTILKSWGFAPQIVFDVGASDGQWSQARPRRFPVAAYTLIEPQSPSRRSSRADLW